MLIGGEKEGDSLRIREYRKEDGPVLAKLFYQTVHTVNVADYTKIQLDVWAPKRRDLKAWNASFLTSPDGGGRTSGQIVGFGIWTKPGIWIGCMSTGTSRDDISPRRSAMNWKDNLECIGSKLTLPSQRGRFLNQGGYEVIREQEVKRSGVTLRNYVMCKRKNVKEKKYELLIKQRVFSWTDTYDIYDEDGNVRYFVKGDFLLYRTQIESV